MNYLLDTNVVVALLRNKPTAVRERFRAAELAGDYLAVSSRALFKLWYGVEKSTHVTENTERLRVFLSGDMDVLAFDDEDAKSAGRVRTRLGGLDTLASAADAGSLLFLTESDGRVIGRHKTSARSSARAPALDSAEMNVSIPLRACPRRCASYTA